MTKLSTGPSDVGLDRQASLTTTGRQGLLSFSDGGCGLSDEELHAVTGGESKPKGGLAGG
jgi:hypothetical protein